MECPKCGYEQEEGREACMLCGLIFSRYNDRLEARKAAEAALPPGYEDPEADERQSGMAGVFLYVKPEINIINFGGRAVFFMALMVFGIICISSPIDNHSAPMRFLHMVNLPFHEAGHIIFGLSGSRFLTVLGGSLLQVLIPLICAGAFLLQVRDTFGASACLWWAGESLMDLAPYINDARALNLILLGGVTGRDVPDYHDWEYLLKHTGLLRYDHFLAYTAYGIGVAFMIVSFIWGGYVLSKQLRNLSAENGSA